MATTSRRLHRFTCLALGGATIAGWLAAAPAGAAVTAIFEAAGITVGNDAVECVNQGTYRTCESDALTERVLSHSGLPAA
jgi:hypothetical protein